MGSLSIIENLFGCLLIGGCKEDLNMQLCTHLSSCLPCRLRLRGHGSLELDWKATIFAKNITVMVIIIVIIIMDTAG